MSRFVTTGKLPADLLASLLARTPRFDSRVIVGPGIGQDAALVDEGHAGILPRTEGFTGLRQTARAGCLRFDKSDWIR
jgi:hypothetical protein